MSEFHLAATSFPPPGPILKLTPDLGADVVPDGSGKIALTGLPTGINQSTLDSNFETFNAGTSAMQIAHRYQGAATTSDGAGQTQTILTIPVTVASTMTIQAMISGIEASIPSGVGGTIDGVVFRGGAGAIFVASANKFIAESDPLINPCDLNVNVSGNNLIVTVTGKATFTIEWYCIAEIVEKTFI